MSEAFVPLVTGPAPAGDTAVFHLKVLPKPAAESNFESLAPSAPPAGSAPAPAPAQAANPCLKPPVVTMQKQGDVVSGIKIECSCGQIIELACSY